MFRLILIGFPLLVFLILEILFVFPVCRANGFGPRAQAIWTAALLLACSRSVCYEALGGDPFNPNFPLAVVWTWNWLFSAALILVVLAVVLFFVPAKVRLYLLPALALALSGWGFWNGVRIPKVHEVEVACPGLPRSLDGYRIVQLADIHASSAAPRWRTEAIVARANAADADLAVCTGDVVDGKTGWRRADVEPLKGLRAKDGVWFVAGNHEFYGDWNGWLRLYDEWGIRFLRGACVFPRAGLALGGVDDEAVNWQSARRGETPSPDEYPSVGVGGAFASATNGEFRVLLQHRPGRFRENLASHGVGLQLSGHTHGGVSPVLNRLVARANAGFVRGLYPCETDGEPVRKGSLYVSPGCGQWAGFPIRFFDESEIPVITLRAF